MPRLAACSTANFIRRRYSGERYAGSPPRATEMFATNMPLAAMRSKSWTMLSLACAPFQPIHGWMAPYSRGGVLKFAATSPAGGTTICCHGRCANNAPAMSGTRTSTFEIFIRASDRHRSRGGTGGIHRLTHFAGPRTGDRNPSVSAKAFHRRDAKTQRKTRAKGMHGSVGMVRLPLG